MNLVNIGFGNLVNADRVISIVSPESAPVKRIIQESKSKGVLIDATHGRKTMSVIITDSDNGIILSSYEIPEGEDKNTFSYHSMKIVEYSELKKSEKFTPAIYQEKDGVWEGGSVSQFTPVMVFRLWEKFSDTCLEVSESMEVHGKRTFGYDVPIRYKRAASEG